MKAFLSRSAVIVSALLISMIVFSARTSIAETPQSRNPQQGKVQQSADLDGTQGKADAAAASRVDKTDTPATPATSYVATAYSLPGRTASGRMVSRGLIAADPRLLPLGSRVRLEVPGYHGEYLVADTGGMIKGRRIDIWTPTSREAMKFGRRTVKLTVLSYPAKRVRKGRA